MSLTLERGLQITGTVTWWDGSGAAGVDVTAEPGGRRARTDERGAFQLTGLGNGTFALSADGCPAHAFARTDWEHKISVEAQAGERGVVLRLPRHAPRSAEGEEAQGSAEKTLRLVRVVGPDGMPIPRARVRWRVAGQQAMADVVSGLARVPLEASVLEVHSATTLRGAALPYGPARVADAPPPSTPLVVRLPHEHTVEGVLVDADGRPRAGVRLVAAGRVAVVTDRQGRFRFGQLDAGEHRVVYGGSAKHATLSPDVVQAGTQNARLVLDEGVRARVRVVDRHGRAVEGAYVVVYEADDPGWMPVDPDADPHGGHTDASGQRTLRDQRRDVRYTLRVNPPEARSDLAATLLGEWLPDDVEIVLFASPVTRGVVLDFAGAPVAGAGVAATSAETSLGVSATTDARGRFELKGLAPGGARVIASVGHDRGGFGGDAPHPDLSTSESDPMDFTAGVQDLEIRLDAGLLLTVHIVDWPRVDGEHRVRLRRREPLQGQEGTYEAEYSAALDDVGVARFRHGSRDARYTLQVGPLPDGRVALVHDVRPGPDAHEVSLVQGEAITGSVSGPTRAWSGTVTIEGPGFRTASRIEPDGRFEVRGIPPGVWTVRASGWGDETSSFFWIDRTGDYEATITARAGEQVALQLVEREAR